jgi:predicted RNase H-like nuclease (RuvC/YqgF family)
MVMVVTMIRPAHAQDVALLDERVKQLLGKIENLEEANAGQKRQIEALVKEIQSLREHQQNVPTTGFASTEDLRELARKVQEIEEKRKSDRNYLEKEFDTLKKLAGTKTRPPKNIESDKPATNQTPLPGKGVEHVIASGDYISTIAAAYSKELGVKITSDMILRANPGLKPERMIVGKKILIPVPEK